MLEWVTGETICTLCVFSRGQEGKWDSNLSTNPHVQLAKKLARCYDSAVLHLILKSLHTFLVNPHMTPHKPSKPKTPKLPWNLSHTPFELPC